MVLRDDRDVSPELSPRQGPAGVAVPLCEPTQFSTHVLRTDHVCGSLTDTRAYVRKGLELQRKPVA